jgi:hypothetical protein
MKESEKTINFKLFTRIHIIIAKAADIHYPTSDLVKKSERTLQRYDFDSGGKL